MKDPKRSKKVYIFWEIVRIENRFAAISYYDQISHNIILPSPPPPPKKGKDREEIRQKKCVNSQKYFRQKEEPKNVGDLQRKDKGKKPKVFLVSQFEEFFLTFFASVRQQQK